MKANRLHIGEVIQEINSDYFDVLLMKKAKDKSNGIDPVSYTHLTLPTICSV